ncbi:intracellular protein transport protein USO1-like isoform X2 [Thrips palmi]|uniref:Intracellular protein transport protein USO1-like isoform X2 n=1 Tax=Thrips palmi TaxID=161013 RepID=A0A6P8ZKK1_THRPL|nr:intracellular protein transport protein USO1-like isoform X2 [Thrips palmi]
MSGYTAGSIQTNDLNEGDKASCNNGSNGTVCGESESLGILEQFQRLYAERLKRLDGDSELAMHTLKSWVHDLTEQNTMLVRTVEDLERELLKRVDLMHEQLQKTSLVIKRNEHLAKREKSEIELNLRQQVQHLQDDISSLLGVINQANQQGYWSVDNVKLHTVNKNLLPTSPKRTGQALTTPDAAINNSQKNINGDVDSLKNMLADKDAEILNLLERIEEMQDIFTLTSKRVKQAVETEQKYMQEIALNCETECGDSQVECTYTATQESEMTPWVQERLKQQQEQVSALISRVRDLESDCNVIKAERDRLAEEASKPIPPQLSSDPSMVNLSKDLETTRQQLAEATRQVQLLASCVKELEKKNYDTKAALTVEVAEKHDQMLELRKEVHQLDEQVKNANMQTHFKDNIIREMRNELKIARSKISCESRSDYDNKSRRTTFPSIPEASSISDSGVDDGEISSSSHCVQGEIDLLRSQLDEQLKQILEKDQEVCAQKKRVSHLEKELADLQKSNKPTSVSKGPSITLRELEEYRLCTVEGQAAVEELRDEIEAIINDLKIQESKVAEIQKVSSSSKEILQSAQLKLAETDAASLQKTLGEAKDCIQEVHLKAEDFLNERRAGEQRRATRERKVDKLQEQLDASHDNMRDGIEAMEQALAERYEADRLSQREFSDGSSYHSCRDSDNSSCLKQVERLEESNAELLSNLTIMEHQKRDAEEKAAQCLREVEKMKEQISRRSFTDELLHTKDQTINELQGALDSTRRQIRDLQSDYERTIRERDSIKNLLEQQSNSGPLQVAELQSELARVRNQLSTLSSKQALIEQYERRLKDSSDQAEKLSSQLNSVALNLQAKETMLSNKEEMINILQDTLDRTREEMKMLKDKSVSKSPFALPWKNGKKKTGPSSSSVEKSDQDEAAGTASGVPDEQWQVVRDLKLDLSEMLVQYRDCFSEVSRQTRWYRDLREAYQDLRLHAENVKREALSTVNSSQREAEVFRRQCQAQSLQICRLKEQVWKAEQGRHIAESETEELQGRLENYSQQICQFKSRLESLQTQLKETQARMEMSDEQVELRELREFREKWERAARSLADIDQQDKDYWAGLQWCESSESEDSQKREARIEAAMGLLLVEAGRRRRRDAAGSDVGEAEAADNAGKDCESGSTDEGSTKSRDQDRHQDRHQDRDRERDPKPFPEPPRCESQGQLQGVLEENQQLRDQLGQLRAHNAALASQLQEQYVESARCLAGISASLEDDPDTGGALAAARKGLYDVRDLRAGSAKRSLPTPRRSWTGALLGPAGSLGRASRASSSGSSSSGRGGNPHARHTASPEGPEGALGLAPWDYSDHADLCDSGFWVCVTMRCATWRYTRGYTVPPFSLRPIVIEISHRGALPRASRPLSRNPAQSSQSDCAGSVVIALQSCKSPCQVAG